MSLTLWANMSDKPPDIHEDPALVYVPIERHPKDFPLRACIVGYVLVSEVPIRAKGDDG